jgi:diaminobutyrate-2-oxoglutarate transaminase
MMNVFESLESEVRSYCRSFPTVFVKGRGAELVDQHGRRYLDFFAGAGGLNYGHNHPELKEALLAYLAEDGVVHGLDMATRAKEEFLLRFRDVVLAPRGLGYKVQFPGPTGTNAVEAALKLARKVTGREPVFYFHRGFHGMTLGSLAVTSNRRKRAGAGVPLDHARRFPFDGESQEGCDSLATLEAALADAARRDALPAALILETVQGEGGVNVASFEWLRAVRELTGRHGVLLIVDDIQVGCGRTGPFFSFEPAGIVPDIVTLSKSISGYGLPMALVLIRPSLDAWSPGEHNGTFRGHNPAFVTATKALDLWWRDDRLAQDVRRKGRRLRERLEAMTAAWPQAWSEVRGRGLVQGIVSSVKGLPSRLSREAFRRGLIAETAGPADEVLKFLPPLTIEDQALERGLDIVEESLEETMSASRSIRSNRLAAAG